MRQLLFICRSFLLFPVLFHTLGFAEVYTIVIPPSAPAPVLITVPATQTVLVYNIDAKDGQASFAVSINTLGVYSLSAVQNLSSPIGDRVSFSSLGGNISIVEVHVSNGPDAIGGVTMSPATFNLATNEWVAPAGISIKLVMIKFAVTSLQANPMTIVLKGNAQPTIAPPVFSNRHTPSSEKSSIATPAPSIGGRFPRKVELPITETTIDMQALRDLIKNSLEVMIEKIQQPPFNVKVVVVDLPLNLPASDEKYHRVTYRNPQTSDQAIQLYSEEKLFADETTSGMYLPANDLEFLVGDGINPRPYFHVGLILLKTFTSKDTIVHELLHHLIQTGSKFLARTGTKLSSANVDQLVAEVIAAEGEVAAALKPVVAGSASDQQISFALRRVIKLDRANLQLIKLGYGHIDIAWFLNKYSNTLGLPDFKGRTGEASSLVARTLKGLIPQMKKLESSSLLNVVKDNMEMVPPEEQLSFQAFIEDRRQTLGFKLQKVLKIHDELKSH